MKSLRDEIEAYVTRDGSIVRELMHPSVQGNRAQSLAEAAVPPETSTLLHRHALTEEIYHFTAGEGIMTLGNERFAVRLGDTVCIAPGHAHRLVLQSMVPPATHLIPEISEQWRWQRK